MPEKFLEKTPEKRRSYELINFRIQDEIGTFSIEENEDGVVMLEVANQAGKK